MIVYKSKRKTKILQSYIQLKDGCSHKRQNSQSIWPCPQQVPSFIGKRISGVRIFTGPSKATLIKCNTRVSGEKGLHRKLVYFEHSYPLTGSFQEEQRDTKIHSGEL